MSFFQGYCFDCGKKKINHLDSWLEDLLSFLPVINLPKFLNNFLDWFLEKIFIILGLLKYEKVLDVSKLKIPLRSKIFISEAQKNNISIFIGKSIFGYTNNFQAKVNNKIIRFCGLPVADFLNPKISLIDDKEYVKKILIQNNFPVPKGKVFWFWQKNKALNFAKKIGFPVIVKPRTGSVARHVTTNILNEADFKKAVLKVREYAPTFLVEEHIIGFVHRITLIDFDNIFCVRQIPANVCGDGKSKISELIQKKNSNPMRGEAHNKDFTLYKILIDKTTDELLKNQGYSYESIPKKGEIVYLQKDPFLRLGGDLEDLTFKIHPDNKKLFQDVARLFNIRVVGIDFIATDISKSWRKQKCGILELNTLPSIELHTIISGEEKISKALVEFFKKYYL
jgi:D-alanine-D-alanine ligase-like ATP-grasp enzyme